MAQPMSTEDLTQEMLKCSAELDYQMRGVQQIARTMGCEPWQVRTKDGGFMLAPLLVAKANLLVALKDMR